ncbi:unnamed protein product [Closterium sp. NIES-64]|nr:unnamed protein product [Closterium sp. NIES-64]
MRGASSRTRRRLFASLTLFVPIILVLATCSRLSLPRVHFSLRLEWPEGRPHHHNSTSLPGSDHAVAGASQQSQRSQRRALAENSSAVPPPPPPVSECAACPAGDSGRSVSGPGGDARSGGGEGTGARGGGDGGAAGGGEAAWGENHAFRVHPTSISLFAVVSTYRTIQDRTSFMVVGWVSRLAAGRSGALRAIQTIFTVTWIIKASTFLALPSLPCVLLLGSFMVVGWLHGGGRESLLGAHLHFAGALVDECDVVGTARESLLGAQLHLAGALVDECLWQGEGAEQGGEKEPPVVAPAETLHVSGMGSDVSGT